MGKVITVEKLTVTFWCSFLYELSSELICFNFVSLSLPRSYLHAYSYTWRCITCDYLDVGRHFSVTLSNWLTLYLLTWLRSPSLPVQLNPVFVAANAPQWKNQVKLSSSLRKKRSEDKREAICCHSRCSLILCFGFLLCYWFIVIQTVTKVEEKASERDRERK